MASETLSSYLPTPAAFGRLSGIAVVGVGAAYILNKMLKEALQEAGKATKDVAEITKDVAVIVKSLVAATQLSKDIIEIPAIGQAIKFNLCTELSPRDKEIRDVAVTGIFAMIKDIKSMALTLQELLESPILQGYVTTAERMMPPQPLPIEGSTPPVATVVVPETTNSSPPPTPDEIVKIIDASKGALATLTGLIALDNMKSMVQVAIYLIRPEHVQSNLRAITISVLVVLFGVWFFFFATPRGE